MTKKSWYQIPQRGDEPGEEMIEWLNECEQDWDGDDEGVTITPIDGGDPVLGNPGDWIYRDENDVYHIVTEAEKLGVEK